MNFSTMKRRVLSIEDLLYPLLRGRDVGRWVAEPSLWILMMQDPRSRRGIDESIVQERYPKTWAYLKGFEGPLRERSGFKRYFTRKDKEGHLVETGPFYWAILLKFGLVVIAIVICEGIGRMSDRQGRRLSIAFVVIGAIPVVYTITLLLSNPLPIPH